MTVITSVYPIRSTQTFLLTSMFLFFFFFSLYIILLDHYLLLIREYISEKESFSIYAGTKRESERARTHARNLPRKKRRQRKVLLCTLRKCTKGWRKNGGGSWNAAEHTTEEEGGEQRIAGDKCQDWMRAPKALLSNKLSRDVLPPKKKSPESGRTCLPVIESKVRREGSANCTRRRLYQQYRHHNSSPE